MSPQLNKTIFKLKIILKAQFPKISTFYSSFFYILCKFVHQLNTTEAKIFQKQTYIPPIDLVRHFSRKKIVQDEESYI